MSSTARFTWLVVGAVAITLVLAAAISAAMDGGNSLSRLAHQAAIHPVSGGDTQPRDGPDQNVVPATPPLAAPEPTADVDQDEAEPEPGEGRDHDRHAGAVTTTAPRSAGGGSGRGDGHDSSDGHDSGGDHHGGRG